VYAEASGQFTYWSKMTFAYASNSGLRIDYFLCSPSLFPPTAATSSSGSNNNNSDSGRTSGGSANGTVSTGASVTGTTTTGSSSSSSSSRGPHPEVVDYISLHADPLTACSDHCPIMLVVRH
jgi:hypothetical protein